jgi:spore germination protein GerM
MQDYSPRRISIVVGLFGLMVASASTAAFLAWKMTPTPPPSTVNSAKLDAPKVPVLTPSPSTTNNPPKSTVRSATEATTPPVTAVNEQTLQIYWLKASGQQWELVGVPLQVQADDRPEALLNAAVSHLLTTPPTAQLITTIPQGTQLNHLQVQADGIHIDLSKSFNVAGGSTGSTGRVAQILYTATSLNPTAAVWLSVDGKLLESLGGEGLMLEQPLTRQSFERDFGPL